MAGREIEGDTNDKTDITYPRPPMDRPEVRTSMVSLDTFMVLPKKELFFHTIKICNENTKERNFTTEKTKSLCLNQKDLKYIRKELMQYVNHNPQNNYDPYGCYAANDFFMICSTDLQIQIKRHSSHTKNDSAGSI